MAAIRRRERARREDLETLNKLQKRMLTHGSSFFPEPVFQSDEDARLAWETHGAALMPEFIAANPGRRPWGWWQFEATIPPVPETEHEELYLRRLGLLSPDELVVVESEFDDQLDD